MNFAFTVNDTWMTMFLVLTGPFIGSFISASALSWPMRSNLGLTRSVCDQCGTRLKLVDLIPLLGFILLKGKCRACKAPILRQHIIAELASTVIALASVIIFSGWMMPISALLGFLLLFIALVDHRTQLIPDGASFSLIGAGALVLFFLHGKDGLLTALTGALIGYGIFWLVAFGYRHIRGRDGLGMGDAKLLAGGGAVLGPMALPWVILLASSSALVLLLLTSKEKELHRDTQMPFGPALALAIYALWLWQGTHDYGVTLLNLAI